ncbi:MAG: UPF0175 family protein [Moorea sp. SIO2B7]|nr:UPF0175 family protein [Moorena sp. SIO2B7]
MYQVTLSVPEETAQALKLKPEQLAQELCLTAAMKLYELGKLSSGAAAQLAGIERVVFLSKLSEYGINTLSLTEAELTEDLVNV